MDRQQIGLKLTLDALGIPFRLDSFLDRLTVQKAVYLAQAAGVQLGYPFRWYERGPYSSELRDDVFGVVAEICAGSDESEGWNLDPTSVQQLSALRPFLAMTDTIEKAQKLELLASVHFLVNSGSGRNFDTEQIHQTLRRYGKDFSESDVRSAIEELGRHGLGAATGA